MRHVAAFALLDLPEIVSLAAFVAMIGLAARAFGA
jgi:hypothetical protein